MVFKRYVIQILTLYGLERYSLETSNISGLSSVREHFWYPRSWNESHDQSAFTQVIL